MKKKISSKMDVRAQNVIENDRLNVTRQSIEVISRDITAVLEEYFNLSSKPVVKINSEKGKYTVAVEAECDSLKSIFII